MVEYEDEDWEVEGPDDEVDPTMPCPECGSEVYDDTDRCPHCGEYITVSTGPWSDKPAWLRRLAVIFVIAIVLTFLWPIARFLLELLSRRG